jgi:sugar lactone lactonase YvrE
MNIVMNRTPALFTQSLLPSSRRINLCVVVSVSLAVSALSWAQNAVSTLAGGNLGYANATGTSAQFRFTNPSGAAVDAAGNVYVADAVNNVIRKIDPNGVVTTFAGANPVSGAPATAGNADGTGAAASFSGPQGIAIDGAGNLYVADTGNHAIRMITPAGVVTTLGGTGGGVAVASGYLDGTGTAARFNSPLGVAADQAGAGGAAINVYVADTQNSAIRQIVVSTKAVTLLAGPPLGGPILTALTDGVGTAARFYHPDGIVSNAAGTTLYVADTFNNAIRSVAITPGPTATVATLAGATTPGYTESTGTNARFNNPAGIALAPGGNILVTDTLNHVVRSITTGGVTSLFAGSPNSAGTTDGLALTQARFNFPSGVASNATGTYIVSTNSQTVRKVFAATAPSISGQPASASVAAGSPATFSVTAAGNPPVSYQWQRSNNTGASWSNLSNGSEGASGVTTSQLTINPVLNGYNNYQYRVLVSNGISPDATSSAAILTVTQAPVISSANNATFLLNQLGSFSVLASGSPAPTFSVGTGFPAWAGFNTSTGVISGTPTDTIGSPFTFQITATSAAGSTSQTFTLTVATILPPVINTQPTAYTVPAGQTSASFSVSASGNPAITGYQWQRQAGGAGAFADVVNGTPSGVTYTGATSSSLTISGVNGGMNGDVFRVVISNGSTTTSNSASLLVPPTFTTPSSIQFAVSPNSNFFTIMATGSPTPVLSLSSGTLPTGILFTGGSGSAVLSGVTDVSGIFNVGVTATNSGGSTTQNLTINVTQPQAPTITSPASASFTVNQAGVFHFTATGAPAPTFTLSGPSLPAGMSFSSPTLSGAPISADNSPLIFTLTASNGSGTVQQTFTLTIIGVAPTITGNPSSVAVSAGAQAMFVASATGSPTPTLRWQRQPGGSTGFVDLPESSTYIGTQTGTLVINNVAASMNGDQFRLSATNNSLQTSYSTPATLTVDLGVGFTTVAGFAPFAGSNDGLGTNARFNSLSSIATNFTGNVYIADTVNHTIRVMSSAGVVTTIAGLAGVSGSADGVGNQARFNSPQGVAVDSIGNLYVSDTFNNTIRRISPDGTVTTLAGSPGISGAVDAVGAAARFSLPSGIVVDLTGTVYVADTGNHAIRRIETNGTVSTFAGFMGLSGSVDNIVGSAARFSSPVGLARDGSGNLWVADSVNNVIRLVTTSSSVSTPAGLAGAAGSTDGTASAARFNRPYGIAVDSSGNVYVADTFNSTVRKMTSSFVVTTLAGLAGNTGSSDGVGSSVRFNEPFGIGVDAAGAIYVADTRNNTLRRSSSGTAAVFSTQPANRAAGNGSTVTFTATATGSPAPGYQWQRFAAVGGTGFTNISNDATYGGVNTNTLTISNVTSAMNGDRFRVIANNGFLPVAESNSATLTIGVPAVFTSPATATFQAQKAGSFTITSTSDTATTYSATGLPSWTSLNSLTGEIAGTPPDQSGSPFTATITAFNGVPATQTLTIIVTPPELPPTIVAQPAGVSVAPGQSASFAVTAQGTGALSYQWFRNGAPINGATASSLTIANVQSGNAGAYSVRVVNAFGSATSNAASLVVNTVPIFSTQPRSQVVLVGSAVTFNVAATGGSSFTYQWRRNGVPIPGANSATLALAAVAAGDAGIYDVVVTSAVGPAVSSVAELSVVNAPVAPLITAQPAGRTVIAGTATTLSVGATGVPAPTYQWRRNGANIPGATGSSFVLSGAQTGDSGNYQVVVSNASGSVTSASAVLQVAVRSFAGHYFGTFSGGGSGNFALYVREDNSAVFLGFLPGAVAPVMSLNVTINDAGAFVFSQGAITTGASEVTSPARAAALAPVVVSGTIGNDGNLTGNVIGGATLAVAGTRIVDGATAGVAGFYQGGSGANGATVYTIVSPNGQAFAVAQSGTTTDGGVGIASSNGALSIATSRTTLSGTVSGASGGFTASLAGAISGTFNGGSDSSLARQRLVNISSRARVTGGDSVAIAGFVISGEESKPVLIRAVGPTLGAAPFNVPGALAAPRLELFRGPTSLAVNAGIAGNRAVIDAASAQAGAFALAAAGTDAAIVTTLAPGNYTAVVSSATNAAGVALVEVYDLSAINPGQKLLNIATRAAAGANENTLIAGFVIPPGTSKRVLIRGVGPGLTPFNVTGVLAQPVLTLLSGSTTVAQNTNWNSSPDAALITSSSAQVGAFGLANNDSALIATLAPGNYTAQVTGVGGATGVALIEVYELP